MSVDTIFTATKLLFLAFMMRIVSANNTSPLARGTRFTDDCSNVTSTP